MLQTPLCSTPKSVSSPRSAAVGARRALGLRLPAPLPAAAACRPCLCRPQELLTPRHNQPTRPCGQSSTAATQPTRDRQWAPAARRAERARGCIQSAVGREGIPPLCSAEAPPAGPCPALGAPAQTGHEPGGASPEEGHLSIGAMEHLSYEENLRELGVFSLEKAAALE